MKKGSKHTDETRAKMSAASKGKPKSVSHRENISKGQIGRKHSVESCAKISASRKIWLELPGSKESLGYNKGRVVPEEIRIRTSKSLKGRIFTQDHRHKLSISATGRKLDKETRRKISLNKSIGYKKWPRYDYAGIRFRSKWEVAVAKSFDASGIIWGYETKRFELDDTTSYRPDFYLPELGCYWEVKGYFSPRDKNKINLFREKYPEIPLVVATEPVLKLFSVNLKG